LTQTDVAWLTAHFLPGNSAEGKTAQAELDAQVLRLQQAIKSLRDHTDTYVPANLYLTDALRVQGQLQQARQMLTRVTQPPSDPEAAYVLAMLDFAEPEPSFGPIIDRLNVAAAAERIPGRATASLIYALARAGRRVEAEQQFTALTRMEPRSLKLALGNYFAATEAPPPAESASSAPRAVKHSATETASLGSNYAEAMALAATARGTHDYELAARLYSHALSYNPSSVEAMVALGDIAKLQNKLAIASSHYAAALRQNPKSDFALRAMGDLRWETGERAAAVELYRNIPAQQRGARIAQRLAESGSPEPVTNEAPEDPETP
jgi:tetratricopeptide (TPR) repeat protein